MRTFPNDVNPVIQFFFQISNQPGKRGGFRLTQFYKKINVAVFRGFIPCKRAKKGNRFYIKAALKESFVLSK